MGSHLGGRGDPPSAGAALNLSEVQVDSAALLHNLSVLTGLARGAPLVAVVKGNAYGHGLADVVRILDPHVDAFQVDDLDELREIRRHTGKRVLVLGYVRTGSLSEAASLNAELTLYDLDRMAEVARLGIPVHLKIDALLGRQGVLPREIDAFLDQARKHPMLRVLTAYAHFANIEDTTDLGHAQAQTEAFDHAFGKVRELWPDAGKHLSATSGLMTLDSAHDLVRLGIGLYGMYPSAPLARRHEALELQPVMRWVSHLAQVKTLPARHPVGYGLTYITPRETRIGIVPQGYSDGYDRGLSSVGEVLVQGVRCPVLGRVAMNMFAVDLSGVPEAVPEEEVVLLGAQGSDRITAEELASRIGTINYEVTTRVSPLLPRVVTKRSPSEF